MKSAFLSGRGRPVLADQDLLDVGRVGDDRDHDLVPFGGVRGVAAWLAPKATRGAALEAVRL